MSNHEGWTLLLVTYGPVVMFFGWLWYVVLVWARGLVQGDQLAHNYFLNRPQHQTDVRREILQTRRRNIARKRHERKGKK